jgi:hypothetical protein
MPVSMTATVTDGEPVVIAQASGASMSAAGRALEEAESPKIQAKQ